MGIIKKQNGIISIKNNLFSVQREIALKCKHKSLLIIFEMIKLVLMFYKIILIEKLKIKIIDIKN